MADAVARIGGSWPFVIGLSTLIFIWIGLNILYLFKPFDPYPFILLNLLLSTLAGFQAPIIMMSNNRQAEKDRERDKRHFESTQRAEELANHAIYLLENINLSLKEKQ